MATDREIGEQAAKALVALPASARPRRERTTLMCACGWDPPLGPTCPDCELPTTYTPPAEVPTSKGDE